MAQTAAHAHPKRRRAGRLPLVLLLVTFLTVGGGVLIYFAVSAAGKPISAPVPEAPFDVGAPTDPGGASCACANGSAAEHARDSRSGCASRHRDQWVRRQPRNDPSAS